MSESKQQQVLAPGRLGWSLREIAAATGVRRETSSGYLRAAGIAVLRRGGRREAWPPSSPATMRAVSTDPAVAPAVVTPQAEGLPIRPGRAPTASACEPYREMITAAVRRDRNAMAIWRDLVDQHWVDGRYASVRRFVGRVRGTATPEPSGIIETASGEEAQVDYGEGTMVRDPGHGRN